MSATLSPSLVHPFRHSRPRRRRRPLRAALRSLRQAYARFGMLDAHR